MDILKAVHLKKYYGSGENLVKAVDDVSFGIEKGSFTAIVGTSGSGKTTLLNLIGGLDFADAGEVIIDGHSIMEMSKEELTVFRRRHIGFVFQNYNLIPTLNVWENIVFPIAMDGQKPDKKFIEEIVGLLGLEQKIHSLPNNLSGGQQQRVAIARARASKPDIILADEPTGNIDSRTSDNVIHLLQMTSQKLQQTIIMITHNPEIAQLTDQTIRIEDGRIVS